jgi:hypothetical protein
MSTMEFTFSIGLHAPSWLILAIAVPLIGIARKMIRDHRTFKKPAAIGRGTNRTQDDEGDWTKKLVQQIQPSEKRSASKASLLIPDS